MCKKKGNAGLVSFNFEEQHTEQLTHVIVNVWLGRQGTEANPYKTREKCIKIKNRLKRTVTT